MSFVADPAAISAFAYTIGSWAPVCQDAIAYSDQWVGGAGAEDGLYYKFRTAANQVNDTIVTRLRRTYTILSDASGELDNLARYYQQTDEQCAAGFPALSLAAYQDATYVVPPDPGYDVTPLDTSASFANAAVHLPVPSGCDPIPDYVDMIMRQGQIFYAPSDIVIKILTWCNHGKNPLDDVYQHFCGNWNAAESGCQALEYLATLHEQMADSVWQSKNTVMDTWEGNSAEAANYYFKKLISALDDIVPGLRSASASFHEVASGMQLAATAAEGAMTMLADEVLFALADMAISAILVPTGVGNFIGLVLDASSVWRLIKDFKQYADAIGSAVTACEAFTSAMAGIAGTCQAMDGLRSVAPLPGANYDNPFADEMVKWWVRWTIPLGGFPLQPATCCTAAPRKRPIVLRIRGCESCWPDSRAARCH